MAPVSYRRRELVGTGGVGSPAALSLREKRMWQGLTSDFCLSPEQANSAGLQHGALVEGGCSGLASGNFLAPMALCSDSRGIPRGVSVSRVRKAVFAPPTGRCV